MPYLLGPAVPAARLRGLSVRELNLAEGAGKVAYWVLPEARQQARYLDGRYDMHLHAWVQGDTDDTTPSGLQ